MTAKAAQHHGHGHHGHGGGHGHGHGGADHGVSHYVKIWAILLVLLIVSVCGPMLGVRAITILTAFGIAIVKAVMVASEFMHLKLEKRYITLMMVTMLFLMGIFFFGTAPDVMTPGGQNWIRLPIQEAPAAITPEHEGGEEHH